MVLPRLRTALRALAALVAALLALAALYAIAAWIGSALPRNGHWQEPAYGIEILVETNGTHTGVVVPVVTPEKDWRETFPFAAFPRADGQLPTHIAIGWGEREVFMETPTWGDLRALTVLRILTVGSDTVMRVSPYVRPAPGPWHRPLRITHNQYLALVARIESSLAEPDETGTRIAMRGVEPGDAYYRARGTYTLARTCNSWTGDVLGDAGVRVGRWTPFAGGVTQWFPAEEPQGGDK